MNGHREGDPEYGFDGVSRAWLVVLFALVAGYALTLGWVLYRVGQAGSFGALSESDQLWVGLGALANLALAVLVPIPLLIDEHLLVRADGSIPGSGLFAPRLGYLAAVLLWGGYGAGFLVSSGPAIAVGMVLLPAVVLVGYLGRRVLFARSTPVAAARAVSRTDSLEAARRRLEDGDVADRRGTARWIHQAAIRDPDGTSVAVPDLVAGLDDPDDEVRIACCRALAALANSYPGQVHSDVETLVEALSDGTPAVRVAAADVVAALAGEYARDVAPAASRLGELVADGDPAGPNAARALAALAAVTPDAVVEVLPSLLAGLESDDERLRADAAAAVASLAAERADLLADRTERLLSGLDDPSPAVRRELARAVAALAEADPSTVRSGTGTLLASLSDPDADVREGAAKALSLVAETDPGRFVDAVSRLADALDDDRTARYVAHALSQVATHDPDTVTPVVPRLFDHLSGTSDPVVRRETTAILGAVARTDPGAVKRGADEVAALVDAEDAQTRRWALFGLAQIGEAFPEVLRPELDAVARRLGDDDPQVRVAAARALGANPPTEPDLAGAVVDNLGTAMVDDDHPTVREMAATGIGAAIDRADDEARARAVDRLESVAEEDPDPDVRNAAESVLAAVGGGD